jgi:hypothetical protein
VTEEFIADFVKRAAKQKSWLADDEICSLLERVYRGNEDLAIRSDAAYRLAQRFAARNTEDGTALAERWYNDILETFPDTKIAKKAQLRLDTMNIAVGKVAPDFEAEDVEGNAFKLSDYRGKVVVLDFWGFW